MKMSTRRETGGWEDHLQWTWRHRSKRRENNVPGARWLSTISTLCHDQQALVQMNPEDLLKHPVSILIQICCMEQLSLLGNVKNPSLGSGNLVLSWFYCVPRALCPYQYISLLWFQIQTTHCDTGCSFLLCLPHRMAVKGVVHTTFTTTAMLQSTSASSFSNSGCSGT